MLLADEGCALCCVGVGLCGLTAVTYGSGVVLVRPNGGWLVVCWLLLQQLLLLLQGQPVAWLV